jgi:hypothetical protein
MTDVALKITWERAADRLSLRWSRSPQPLPDPSASSLWEVYRTAAALTQRDRWSFPQAPCLARPDLPVFNRTLEPLAAYEHGLRLYEALDSPTPADELVRIAMLYQKGFIELDMAAEKLRGTNEEGYRAHAALMGPAAAEIPKPLGMVTHWLGGVGILGVSLGQWNEVGAAIQFLNEAMDLDPPEFRAFLDLLLARSRQAKAEEGGDAARAWEEELRARLGG